jgi:hypothetical protein
LVTTGTTATHIDITGAFRAHRPDGPVIYLRFGADVIGKLISGEVRWFSSISSIVASIMPSAAIRSPAYCRTRGWRAPEVLNDIEEESIRIFRYLKSPSLAARWEFAL